MLLGVAQTGLHSEFPTLYCKIAVEEVYTHFYELPFLATGKIACNG